MVVTGRGTIVRSSLPYQILLYLNIWYSILFWICEALIFVYKGETLPFPTGNLASEIVLLFLFAGIESFRIYFGQKGNLTERVPSVAVSIILTIPVALLAIFFIIWQTYVLRAEVILCGILLTFIGLELIFGIISLITFIRAPTG